MMHKVEIAPRRGVQGLSFGASHDQVRTYFGPGWEPFRRAGDDAEGEYWKDVGLFSYYDSAASLKAIEFAPELAVALDGRNLFGMTGREALAYVRSLDPAVAIEDDGFTSTALGVAVWTEDEPDDEEAEVRSVLVFADGYDDQ